MIDTSVLILAAGEQARWENDNGWGYKQLLYAGDETILGRICRQVDERGYMPTIVTHKLDLMLDGYEVVAPFPRRWKVESIMSIRSHWGYNRTVILLGDVIYQGHVMNRILDNDDQAMFFGNFAEIFAYSFRAKKQAIKTIGAAIQRCETTTDIGSLHSLFRAYASDYTTPYERLKQYKHLFTHVTGDGGWTRDIDSPKDYDLFLEQVIKPGKLDDRRSNSIG